MIFTQYQPTYLIDIIGIYRHVHTQYIYMGVSKNNGTPKSSILIGFSIINHPFWGTPIFGNTPIYIYTNWCIGWNRPSTAHPTPLRTHDTTFGPVGRTKKFPSPSWCGMVGILKRVHSWKLIWNPKMKVWFRWFSFEKNRWFSGSMLIFQGVLVSWNLCFPKMVSFLRRVKFHWDVGELTRDAVTAEWCLK